MTLLAESDYSDLLIEKMRRYFQLQPHGQQLAALLNGSCYLQSDGEDRWLLVFLHSFHYEHSSRWQSDLTSALSHILGRSVDLVLAVREGAAT
ncbi:MAG: hypothetical protein Q7T33_14180 [Dehalococcoidia bacterium]|nr:hypothetical protein [Dehalococcoidia bacterium]